MSAFVSAPCAGEYCRCGAPATHKLGEEIPPDDPLPNRHNLTAYVCCLHFVEVVGMTAASCILILPKCENHGCHCLAAHAEHWHQAARYWCEAHTPWSGHYENCPVPCREILSAKEKPPPYHRHSIIALPKEHTLIRAVACAATGPTSGTLRPPTGPMLTGSRPATTHTACTIDHRRHQRRGLRRGHASEPFYPHIRTCVLDMVGHSVSAIVAMPPYRSVALS